MLMTPSFLEYHPTNSETTVVVGMSGGVDSSVSALLLKRAGYRVIGLFMKNWDEKDERGVCLASKEYEDVVRVCEKIDIPYYSVEFIKEYQEQVFKSFLEEYQAGHTPNPDILCNREIKFKVFFDYAMELGADFLATGHYCQHIFDGENHRLVKGVDPEKDQTYFLYTMKEEILKKVLFPIGHLQKSQVRDLANQESLATMDKKDSTGICFIGERNFKNFLSQYVTSQKGEFQTLAGEVVGSHDGQCFFTIGQRKGLGLGGPGEPWYVVDKNPKRNIVYVERGDRHPRMYSFRLKARELSWVEGDIPNFSLYQNLGAKNRYRQQDQLCQVINSSPNEIELSFSSAQRALTLRQSVVLYGDFNGERVCLGGGMIEEIGPTLDQLPDSQTTTV